MTVAPVRRAAARRASRRRPRRRTTTTVSPGCGSTARTAAHAVAPATNSEPATSHGTPAGFGVRCSAVDDDVLGLARAVVGPADDLVADARPCRRLRRPPRRRLRGRCPARTGTSTATRSRSAPRGSSASPGLMPAARHLDQHLAGTGPGTARPRRAARRSHRTRRIEQLACPLQPPGRADMPADVPVRHRARCRPAAARARWRGGRLLLGLVRPDESVDSAATKASCGTSTRPMVFIRFLPSFCFSSSLRLRVMSPP